jgi:hypothetical protein
MAAIATWSIANDGNGDTELTVAFDTVCYVAGTHLATPGGDEPVESLLPGDTVLILEDGVVLEQPVRWVGQTRVNLDRHNAPARAAPIRIRADAFEPGMPHRDLLVSPDHAVFLDGALFQAQALVNGATIVREPARGAVTYVHVELDRHSLLLAEGLPAESYLDTGNRGWFAAEAGVRPLFPDFASQHRWAANACAPLLLRGPELAAAHAKLWARAIDLGHERTDDPALGCRSQPCGWPGERCRRAPSATAGTRPSRAGAGATATPTCDCSRGRPRPCWRSGSPRPGPATGWSGRRRRPPQPAGRIEFVGGLRDMRRHMSRAGGKPDQEGVSHGYRRAYRCNLAQRSYRLGGRSG